MKNLVISCLNAGQIHNWKIPQRAQGFINNYYAHLNNLRIGLNVSEELFFNNFKSLEESCKNYKNYDIQIIFCSSLQLINVEKKKFISFYKKFKIHFAIEMNSGKGEYFLNKVFLKNNFFINKNYIDVNNFKSYGQIYSFYKKKLKI